MIDKNSERAMCCICETIRGHIKPKEAARRLGVSEHQLGLWLEDVLENPCPRHDCAAIVKGKYGGAYCLALSESYSDPEEECPFYRTKVEASMDFWMTNKLSKEEREKMKKRGYHM